MSEESKNPFDNAEVISTYTKEQAIEDGVLVDIWNLNRDLCENAGFKIPVVITSGVNHYVQVPEKLKGLQNYKGRLWDVLWMARVAFKSCILKATQGTDREELIKDRCRIVSFKVAFTMSVGKDAKEGIEYAVPKLWLVFNEYEGFTIMLPDEY